MENCVFCKIIKGDIPCHKIYEDENIMAFLDVKPHAKGHTVLIPKEHGETVFDLSEETNKTLMATIVKVMGIIKAKLSPDGFNVGWNHNTAGGQVVPHLHVHIMPRYNDDGGGSMHSIVNNPQVDVGEVAELFN